MGEEVLDESDWLGWGGVQARIEDAYYNALVDFGFAIGELT